MKIAVYPGSFDPFTYGHLDIAMRAKKIFDEVIILVASNSKKHSFFTVEERVGMIKESLAEYCGIYVDSTSSLVVDYMKEHAASYIIRGLRNSVDFEYEYTLENSNLFLDEKIETVYFTSRKENMFLSSSIVKEYKAYGIDCLSLVPEVVDKALGEKFIKK